ncbi:MAG: Fe-S-containing hydro-lyase [Fusobacterium perfoetens]|uniref:Fe-S-containing hydro-lyase n=1 Tax=Fusobacterium perfoetens TaxID=852 RepID=UPI0023F0D614|nr:Fe-S-containing hydro-lyase [Fusobacterium perfoetens]MCI6152051.1 Fe-S-containing hydro-lyase [Fusobacterium perfoetens]MDY3238058.1 Fe-S-containing hydro-lyase [Fusobacterium perfoetens]
MKLTVPFNEDDLKKLKIGNTVFLTGTIYTARDAAHKRLVELIKKGEKLPIELKNQAIFYVGPTPPKPGQVIGSAGPTTSYRMDPYAPLLIENGLRGMIGKGGRSPEVIDSIKKYGAVYFGAIGGAGALLSKAIKKAELIAYEDLGAEAIRKLEVVDFPVVVINDIYGNDLYKEGQSKWNRE